MKKIFLRVLFSSFFLLPTTIMLDQNDLLEDVSSEALAKEEDEIPTEEVEEVDEEEAFDAESYEGLGEEGEEDDDDGEGRADDPALVVDRMLTLLIESIGRLAAQSFVETIKGLRKIKTKIVSDFKKGFIEIPRIGLLKFKKVTEEFKKKVRPKLVGILYDVTGKTVQVLRAGAFTLKILRMVVTGQVPQIECEVVFFKHKGKLTQTASSEGVITLKLEFEKPFMIPTGLNRQAPINNFIVKLSSDERYAQTKARIFGTKTEEPSLIRLDLSYIPFTFRVQSKNIPMVTIEPALKATPLANVVLRTLTLRIIPFPPSVNLTGVADMSKAQVGPGGQIPDARVTAGLGMMGFYFLLDVKNWVLPYNLGMLHQGQIKVGTPM